MMENKKIPIPKDLKAYCRRQVLKRVLPCIFMFVVFGLILLKWGTVIFATQNKIFLMSCCVAVMILPFVLTGVPHKLIDKTYHGIVTKVDVITALSCKSAVKVGGDMMWYTKNTIILTVLLENEKSIKMKVYEGQTKLGQHLNSYHEGDKVFHLYGTNVTIVLPDSADTRVQCSVCGTSNNIKDDKCRECGHSLVKRI